MGGKTDVEQLKGILQQFSREDLLKAMSELGLTAETEAEVPFEEIKMSELPDEREEQTRVLIMDKKMKRKVRPGEEERLDEIAAEEGVSEYSEGAPPGGSTVISGWTISARSVANAIVRDFGRFCRGGAIFMSDGFSCILMRKLRKCFQKTSQTFKCGLAHISTAMTLHKFSQVL